MGCTLPRFGAAFWSSVTRLTEEALTLWVGFWAAYDNLGDYTDDTAIPALIVTVNKELHERARRLENDGASAASEPSQ